MRRTPPTPRCTGCAYPLGGLAAHRCPECGRPFDLSDPSTYDARGSRFLAPRIAYLLGVPPLAAALFVGYLHCFNVIFDNPAAPPAARAVVWILGFPLLYLSMLGGEWAFESSVAFSVLLAGDAVLWAAGLVTVGGLIQRRVARWRRMSTPDP